MSDTELDQEEHDLFVGVIRERMERFRLIGSLSAEFCVSIKVGELQIETVKVTLQPQQTEKY